MALADEVEARIAALLTEASTLPPPEPVTLASVAAALHEFRRHRKTVILPAGSNLDLSALGVNVVESPLVEEGTAYIVDPSAFVEKLPLSFVTPEPIGWDVEPKPSFPVKITSVD